jgi:hypothetical protein
VKRVVTLLPAAVLGSIAAPAVNAHFKLLEPASWLVEDDRGDPQKVAPCGGTAADPGVLSLAVTEVEGGSRLTIRVEETIFHPGHYRIALARSWDALPPHPLVTLHHTERGMRSASAVIEAEPAPPVLVDGLWAHTEARDAPWETEIEIPNIDCTTCTLQVIQFMAEHPGVREGGFSYHHCAVLSISADPDKPVASDW